MNISYHYRRLSDQEIRTLAKKNASQAKPLSPLLDIVFKDIFSVNDDSDSRRALLSLLSACTRRQVSSVRVLNNEILPSSLDGKTVHLDIHAGFNGGEQADLEMQMGVGREDQKARASFYGAQLLSGQGKRGQPYRKLKRVYQIFFINGVIFPGKQKVPRRYITMEEEEHDRLNGLEEIIFYELPKLEGYLRRYKQGELELGTLSLEMKWGIYFKSRGLTGMERAVEELARGEEGIMSAERILDRVSRDEEEWARALAWERGEMDYRSGLYAAREDGLKIGRAQAHREKLANARKMKDDGLSISQIERYSGLSRREIEGL
jgi:predicted transposase/invertase (TIGR01784 family)